MGRGDHIIIPKSILKRFCGKNNKVSVFYLNTRILDQKFPDEIFTELNYYFNDKMNNSIILMIMINLYKINVKRL